MTEEQELKISRMYKKAQNKRLFTRDNYKLREFVLTSSSLKYFDICGGNRGKLKGSLSLISIKYVEKVQDEELDNKCHVLQIGYVENTNGCTVSVLYIVSNCDDEREDWLQLLRHYSKEEGAVLQPRFHPGIWLRIRGKYGCCGDECRVSMGCALADGVRETRVSECESVVALHEFAAMQEQQISLRKGARYNVVDGANPDWWYLRDESGEVGYAPRSYVRPSEDLAGYPWYYGEVSRQEAESILCEEAREGCFLVRCSANGLTLSLTARHDGNFRIHHYRIRQTQPDGPYFLAEKYVRASVPELIECHQHNSGGLVVRLRSAPITRTEHGPISGGMGLDEFEVDAAELSLDEVPIGRGQFGLVRRGSFRGMPVAVKQMVDGTMNEDDFVEEARNMRFLNHPNLVRLFAVVLRTRPVMIVTEYMRHGSLREFLRTNYADYWSKTGLLSDACAQIAHGMSYLEQRNFVHRDLAARNVLVHSVDRRSLQVKVADFGMTRFLLDNVYEPSAGTKFPVRWAAPEVFQSVYTPRADVWSYGVLMWEVFTGGLQTPYVGQSNAHVYQFIMGGGRLAKPPGCPDRLYVLMLECWQHEPTKRPGFQYIASKVTAFLEERPELG